MKQLLFTIALTLAAPGAAWAFPHEHRETRRFERHFRPVISPWHGGYWHHGFHEHRLGWWWVSGGLWHFYTSPVYPYPPEPPQTTVVEIPVPMPQLPPRPAPAPGPVAVIPHLPTASDSTLFYCASNNTYFPYAADCAEGWTLQQGKPAH